MTFCPHLLLVIPFAPRSPLRYLFSNSLYSLSPSLFVIPFVHRYPLLYLLSPLLLVIPFVTRYRFRYSLSTSLFVIPFGTRYPLRYSLSLSVLVIPFATRFPLRYWLSPFGTRYPLRYSLSPPLLVDTICLFFSYLSGTLDQTKLFKNMTGKRVLQTCYTSDCR